MSRQSKKLRNRREIQRQAILLTIDRGFDGFTMHELAEAADMSRTFIFNHFTDKAGAVLGITVDADAERAEATELASRTPVAETPFQDAVRLVTAVLNSFDVDVELKELYRLMPQTAMREPKLKRVFDERNEQTITWLTGLLRERFADDVDAADTRLIGALLATPLTEAINRLLEDDEATGNSLVEVFHQVVADSNRLTS
ncbi:MAG: TetR/AcrR family transcriptional regulator [Propionibacteriaceae bacterium]|nr:TetR/AcrR family transcriptional regulator [Propionibacteriaceae bacterium]